MCSIVSKIKLDLKRNDNTTLHIVRKPSARLRLISRISNSQQRSSAVNIETLVHRKIKLNLTFDIQVPHAHATCANARLSPDEFIVFIPEVYRAMNRKIPEAFESTTVGFQIVQLGYGYFVKLPGVFITIRGIPEQ